MDTIALLRLALVWYCGRVMFVTALDENVTTPTCVPEVLSISYWQLTSETKFKRFMKFSEPTEPDPSRANTISRGGVRQGGTKKKREEDNLADTYID